MEFPLQTSTYWKESLLSLLEKLSRTFNSRSWKAQRYLKEKAAILEKRARRYEEGASRAKSDVRLMTEGPQNRPSGTAENCPVSPTRLYA